MKKISVMIPTYNEEQNVREIYAAVKEQLEKYKGRYNYEILFIDNFSRDKTREYLTGICSKDKRVKAIFNAKNFGGNRSIYYGLCQTDGDCSIYINADFQDPPEMLPQMISEWENGYRLVTMIKNVSDENSFVYFMRGLYYKLLGATSDTQLIEHYYGSGLYDRSLIEVLRSLNDAEPYLRGIVAELGFERKELYFHQPVRRAGKTSTNLALLYNDAMTGFTSYSKGLLRIGTILGAIVAFMSILIALIYLMLKLCFWDSFATGYAPMICAIFFLGGCQLFFLGFISEYIMGINRRVMGRPLVVEDKRINFDIPQKEEGKK